jgi:hypothetical protein
MTALKLMHAPFNWVSFSWGVGAGVALAALVLFIAAFREWRP